MLERFEAKALIENGGTVVKVKLNQFARAHAGAEAEREDPPGRSACYQIEVIGDTDSEIVL